MTRIKLKNIDRFTDRHGKPRYYYRPARGARIALPSSPGSPEFMLAYEQAARQKPAERERPKRGGPGTFDRLVQDYFESSDYLRIAPQTQRSYRFVIERLLRDEKIGHRLVSQMTRQHVQKIMARRVATPGAANDVLKKLRILLHFAIDNGWRKDNPTVRIKRYPGKEFHTWTDAEIAAYEAHWAVGTPARTAFALLLFTGQRASDVKTMSWQDVQNNAIRVVQRKTGAKLWIPLHPKLAMILAEWPKQHVMILTTSFKRPFTSKGFSNFMADKIGAAGVADRCVTHGLRKAAARRMAEAGCSANEIAAVTGHLTLKEIERYTKGAEQRKLAGNAIGRLEKQDANEDSQT